MQSLSVHLFGFHFLNSGPWNALVLLCYLSLVGVDCVGIRGADEHWQFSGAPHTPGVLCWARCCCSPCWHVPKWGSVKNVPYLTGLSRLVWHNTKQSVMEQELTLLGLADWGEAGSADFGMLLVLLICHCCSLPECLSISARELFCVFSTHSTKWAVENTLQICINKIKSLEFILPSIKMNLAVGLFLEGIFCFSILTKGLALLVTKGR